MREYIFTPRERQILKQYLERGTKEKGFRVLMTRIRKNAPILRKEMELIELLLKSA